MSDAYGTLFWKHFRNVEVIIWLVELNRISGRRECRVYFRSAGKQKCHGTKPPHERRKPSCLHVMTNAYQGHLNAGFSKVCEIFKVRSIESLKYIRDFTHVTLNETNYDWLFDMLVKRPHGQALANESGHLFQIFSWLRKTNLYVTFRTLLGLRGVVIRHIHVAAVVMREHAWDSLERRNQCIYKILVTNYWSLSK